MAAASLLVFLAVLAQLWRSPCLDLYRVGETDMGYFVAWATRIADGDLLSRTMDPPMHSWQASVASDYLALHPGPVTTGASADTAGRQLALWRTWCGTPRFYQDPLYPYALGALFRILGPRPLAGILLNGLLGCLTNVLLGLLGWRLFGRTAGLVSAGLAILCGPIHGFEFALLREPAIIACSVWLPLQVIELQASPRWPRVAGLALTLGLAIALKSIFLLFLPVVIGLLCLPWHRVGGATPRALLLGLGLLALTALPWAGRDMALGLAPGFPRSAGVVFVQGNSSTTSFNNWYCSNSRMAAILGQAGRGFLSVARETLRTHHGVGSYARLLATKLGATLNWFEIPNNINFYYLAAHSSVLRALAVGCGLLVPLAALALCLCLRPGMPPRLRPYLFMLGLHLVVITLFLVQARFRAPFQALLIPLAAFALCRLVEAWRAGHRAVRALVVLGVALGALVAARDIKAHAGRMIFNDDYLAGMQAYYLPRYLAAESREDWPGALRTVTAAARLEPARLRGLSDASAGARDEETRALLLTFGLLHNLRGDIEEKLAQAGPAAAEHERGGRYLRLSGR